MFTIKTKQQAIEVAEKVNEKLPVGKTTDMANHMITKTEDRMFTVNGSRAGLSNTFTLCELAEFIIWPERKTVNSQIAQSRK